MFDAPPEPPPSQEQVIEQKLVDCGLEVGGFSVKYEDYLQGIEIFITSAAAAKPSNFGCIRDAIFPEIVRFEDLAMYQQYTEFEEELIRPQVLANAEASLRELKLWDSFPERDRFTSFAEYVQALEAHAGFTPGTMLRIEGSDRVTLDPPERHRLSDTSYEKLSELLAVLIFAAARDGFGIGFIGNDKIRD